jgi:glutathione reductase (NADPH)
MGDFEFDLITIGAGSGGVAVSKRAALLGARVALCEADRVGGTCVLRGCVPKKLLVYCASYAEEFVDAVGFGWEFSSGSPGDGDGGVRCDWTRMQAAKTREVDRLAGLYRKGLDDAGVTTRAGQARLVDAHTVKLGDRTLTSESIVIATGGWPSRPDIPGAELAITSNEALSLPKLPRRLVVVGGGYIGVEMAGVFAAMGSDVTMVLRGELLLRGFDHDLRTRLSDILTKKGIRIVSNGTLSGLSRANEGGIALSLESGERLIGDEVLLATGRQPNTDGMGLDEIGVHRNHHGAITVDDAMRTSVPSIYAIGDCTDRVNLTPVAIAEGRAVAQSLFGPQPHKVDLSHVPTAVFSMPPLASVGITEDKAKKKGVAVDVYVAAFRPLRNTLSGRDERTFMKLIVDSESQKVLGCHMLGTDAPEIIQALAVAVTAGATKADFDRTIALHPTAAEEFVLMRERRAS